MNKNILVLVPGKEARGGVTNYFNSLRKHLPEEVIYLERGARKFPYNKNVISEIARMSRDYMLFIWFLITKNISTVHTNTSFDKKGILRDAIYLLLARFFGKKTIVFYRGWDEDFANEIMLKWPVLYKQLFLKTTASIVLANSFKSKLEELGHRGEIFVETTTVDSSIIKEHVSQAEKFTIVYLARVEKEKGVFILLDAYKRLKSKYESIELKIGGDGKALPELRERIDKESIQDVEVLGFIAGENKSNLLASADLFVFPTYYKEGMPNSILEAFAFGLPVVTRPVAGILDVFKDKINGFLIESKLSEDFADKIELLYLDKSLRQSISENNREHSNYFISDEVAKRLMTIYRVLNQ